jgi:hypothetical protein
MKAGDSLWERPESGLDISSQGAISDGFVGEVHAVELPARNKLTLQLLQAVHGIKNNCQTELKVNEE